MSTHTTRGDLSDLSDAEWALVPPPPLFPPPAARGRPRQHSVRAILNAIFYAPRAGGAWRLLPHAADVHGRDGGILRKLYRQPADKAGRQAHTTS